MLQNIGANGLRLLPGTRAAIQPQTGGRRRSLPGEGGKGRRAQRRKGRLQPRHAHLGAAQIRFPHQIQHRGAYAGKHLVSCVGIFAAVKTVAAQKHRQRNTLGEKCGGNFVYTETGIKSCVNCNFSHKRENYAALIKRFPELCVLAARREEDKS